MRNLIIIFVVLIPFYLGCNKDCEADPDMEIRGIAWNYLNDNLKSTVNVDWKKAPVTESTFNGVCALVVTFYTTDFALLGPIMVYVDPDTKVVLGQVMRD